MTARMDGATSNLKKFALLISMLQKTPKTFQELMQELGCSRDTVKRHLRVLEDLEMAKRTNVQGQRAQRWEWVQ